MGGKIRPFYSDKKVHGIFKVGISLILVAMLFRILNGEEAQGLVSSFRPAPLMAAALLYMISQLLSAYRWKVLLRIQGFRVSLRRLFSLYLMGMFFNNFLPTSLGGDIVRGVALRRDIGKGTVAATSVFLDRYLGVVVLLIIGNIAWVIDLIFFSKGWPMTGVLLMGFNVVLMGPLFLIPYPGCILYFVKYLQRFSPLKGVRKVFSLHRSMKGYLQKPRLLGQCLIVSVGVQLLNIAVYIIISEMLGIHGLRWVWFLFFPLVTLMTMLPISLNGLGVREWTLVMLFSHVGGTSTQAATISLTWYLLVTAISALGGIAYWARKV